MSFFLVTRRLLVNFAVRFLLILGSLGAFLIFVFGAFKKKMCFILLSIGKYNIVFG